MTAAAIALTGALLAAAAETPAASPQTPLGIVREKVRTSLSDLDKAMRPLEELTAAYGGESAPGAERRAALRNAVSLESNRLNAAYAEFWPLWDVQRFADGARLMGNLASGTEKPEAGAIFLDDSGIDDFKAEVKRMQERAAASLINEQEAFKAFEARRKALVFDRLLAAGAGAGVAALGAALQAWLRTQRTPAPRA